MQVSIANFEGLTVLHLLELARSIGIAPMGSADGSPLTKEVLIQHLRLFTESA